MLSGYRLAYLAILAAAMSGIVAVAAAMERGNSRAGTRFIGFRIAQQPDASAEEHGSEDGTEKGNLSEVGAKEITNEGDFLAALVVSRENPVLIFKHSTECTISGGAYRRTAEWLKERGETAPSVFLVKVIEHRTVSQFVAKQTHVEHQSPQAILVRDGRPIWNTDHEKITGDALSKAMTEFDETEPPDETTD